MKAYIITVKGNDLSEKAAEKTFESAKWAGLDAKYYYGVNRYHSKSILERYNLTIDNTEGVFTKVSYKDSTVGCFLSHFKLWKKCINSNTPFVILEHDVNFTKKFKYELPKSFEGVVNLGKPLWGSKWKSWIDGLYHRTCRVPMKSFIDEYKYCDCEEHFLHGAHAYIITPKAADKLVNYYSENGIVPADNAINTDVCNIADHVPFICEQVREFSLVQRDHPIQEFPNGFIYGDDAWGGEQPRDITPSNLSIREMIDAKIDDSHFKKVMVFICDGNLLDKVKPLIHNAKTKGKWNGDFVLLVPESIDTSLFDDDKDNDLIVYKVPDLMGATIHFHKIFLFDDFFKEWDWVLYSDLDVWYLDTIELNLDLRNTNKLYAPKDRLTYEQQFDEKTLDDSTKRFVMKSKPTNGKSFQTCWMLFSTNNTEWLKYYQTKLINYYFRYHIYQQIALKGYWEQCVFNLVFSDTWVELGSNLVQSEAIHKVWDGELTLDHLKRGYEDRTDYSQASGVHFTFPFAPWFKYNKRFYREWEKCNDEV